MDVVIERVGQSFTPNRRRILVDRLWPRGVSKDHVSWDLWIKEVAPSTRLRQWYAHDPSRFDLFRERYWQELEQNPAVDELVKLGQTWAITLLTATKDLEHSHVTILRDFLTLRFDAP